MDMTFEQYILNPMGRNNAVLNATTRENIRKDYIDRFDKILLRENGKINYKIYKDKKSNTYWFHIMIPSETVKGFTYDVVLKFFADEKVKEAGENLFKYNVNFYSNDPSFVYTFAHVFIENGLFIKELTPKMSKLAVKKDPKITNPSKLVGYVKTLYFAYLYMNNKGLNKKIKIEAEAQPLNIKDLLESIEDADSKIARRQESAGKKETRSTQPRQSSKPKIFGNMNSNINNIHNTKNIKTTKFTTSGIKSSKRTGYIKKK